MNLLLYRAGQSVSWLLVLVWVIPYFHNKSFFDSLYEDFAWLPIALNGLIAIIIFIYFFNLWRKRNEQNHPIILYLQKEAYPSIDNLIREHGFSMGTNKPRRKVFFKRKWLLHWLMADLKIKEDFLEVEIPPKHEELVASLEQFSIYPMQRKIAPIAGAV